MTDSTLPRRHFLTTSAAAVAGALVGAAALPAAADARARSDVAPRPTPAKSAFNLGIASYSLRNFPLEKALEMVQALHTPYVNFKSVHVPYETTPEGLAAFRAKVQAAGDHHRRRRNGRLQQGHRRGRAAPVRVRTGRGDAAHRRHLHAAGRPAPREVREAVRHQGRHSQPRAGRHALPVAVRRARRGEGDGSAHRTVHRRGAYGAHRHRRREGHHGRRPARCSTFTSRICATSRTTRRSVHRRRRGDAHPGDLPRAADGCSSPASSISSTRSTRTIRCPGMQQSLAYMRGVRAGSAVRCAAAERPMPPRTRTARRAARSSRAACARSARRRRPNLVQVTAREAERRVDVTVDGKPFTSYIYPTSLKKPVLYPLRAASGTLVTRGFPLEPRPGERVDHPHHVGFWFNYGNVSGRDFWNNSTAIADSAAPHMGTIVHRAVEGRLERRGRGHAGRHRRLDDLSGTRAAARGHALRLPRARRRCARWSASRRSPRSTARCRSRTTRRGWSACASRAGWSSRPPRRSSSWTRAAGRPPCRCSTTPACTGSYLSSEGKVGDAVWGTRGRWTMLTGVLNGEHAHPRDARSPAERRLSHLLARARLRPVRGQQSGPEGVEQRGGGAEFLARRGQSR